MSSRKSVAATAAAVSSVLLLLGAFAWITFGREGSDSGSFATLGIQQYHSQINVMVCLDLGDGAYDTRQVPQLDANAYLALGLAVSVHEPCDCGPLCFPHSFHQLGNRCLCNTDSDGSSTSSRQNRHLGLPEPRRSLRDVNFLDDENDLSICTRPIDQCSSEKRCRSNQICAAPKQPLNATGATNPVVGRCRCQPVMCANPYGNPCGPDSACRDTPSGYACTSILLSSRACPMSCGLNAQCLPTLVNGTNLYSCLCNTGYVRLAPYLACTLAPVATAQPIVAPPVAAPNAPVAAPIVNLPPLTAPQSPPIAPPKAPVAAPMVVPPPSLPTVPSLPMIPTLVSPSFTAPKALVAAPKVAPATIPVVLVPFPAPTPKPFFVG